VLLARGGLQATSIFCPPIIPSPLTSPVGGHHRVMELHRVEEIVTVLPNTPMQGSGQSTPLEFR